MVNKMQAITWIYALMFMGGFFSACMDTFENTPNFDKSIFKRLNKKWWCKDVSWDYVKLILGYRPDSWHICKSLMWGCIIADVVIAWFAPKPSLSWYEHFIGLGCTWNVSFPLFYNIIFRIK